MSIENRPSNRTNGVMFFEWDTEFTEIVQDILEEEGIPAYTATTPTSGIMALQELRHSGVDISAIFITRIFPDHLDAYEAAKMLKENQFFSKIPRILCVYEKSRKEMEKTNKDLNGLFTDHLDKPFLLEDLFEKINKYRPIT